MSRPLELNIYPQPVADQVVRFKDLSTGQVTKRYMYQDGGLLSSSPPRLDTSKRFTNAELAAEYHSAEHEFDMDWVETGRNDMRLESISLAMYRFATLPHYDEGA